MPLNLLNLPATEAERLAYAEGSTMAAELFARIAELEAERDALEVEQDARIAELEAERYTLEEKLDDLEAELDDLKDSQPDPLQVQQDAQDLEHLKQFFYDCFTRLAGHYPRPEFSSDYDKGVIFAAIERGEELDANGGAE